MGMYDSVVVIEADERFRSATGHFVTEYQTKDLDQEMGKYIIYHEQLFLVNRKLPAAEHVEREKLILTQDLIRTDFSGQVNIYSFVDACKPVLSISEFTFGDMVKENKPWLELALFFTSGELQKIEKVKDQTRELLVCELRKKGEDVLDDEERLAKLHFKKKES